MTRDQSIKLDSIYYDTGRALSNTAILLCPEDRPGSEAFKSRDAEILKAFLRAVDGATTIGGTYDSVQFRFDLAKAIAATVGCMVQESGK